LTHNIDNTNIIETLNGRALKKQSSEKDEESKITEIDTNQNTNKNESIKTKISEREETTLKNEKTTNVNKNADRSSGKPERSEENISVIKNTKKTLENEKGNNKLDSDGQKSKLNEDDTMETETKLYQSTSTDDKSIRKIETKIKKLKIKTTTTPKSDESTKDPKIKSEKSPKTASAEGKTITKPVNATKNKDLELKSIKEESNNNESTVSEDASKEENLTFRNVSSLGDLDFIASKLQHNGLDSLVSWWIPSTIELG